MARKPRSLAGFDDVASDNKSNNHNESESKSEIENKSNINSTSKNASKKDSENKNMNNTASNSNIDRLLQTRKTSAKKHYIGFYATDEVKEFLDQVPSGNKSEIINEALKLIIQNK